MKHTYEYSRKVAVMQGICSASPEFTVDSMLLMPVPSYFRIWLHAKHVLYFYVH